MKSPIEYIKESWGIYTKKENFIFFARVMAVLVIATTSLSFLLAYFYPEDYIENIDYSNAPMVVGFIVITLLSALVGLWSQTTSYLAILKMGSSEKEIFKLGYKYMWRFFLISLVVGLIVLGGMVLLVIPGILFGVWFSFSTLLVLDKNMGVKEALAKSKLMVSSKFWKVVGRFFVIGLFSLLVSLVLTVVPYVGPLLLSFIAPLFSLPFYLLYKDLLASS